MGVDVFRVGSKRAGRVIVALLLVIGAMGVRPDIAAATPSDCDRNDPFGNDVCYSIRWARISARDVRSNQPDIFMTPGYTSSAAHYQTVSATWVMNSSLTRFIESGYANDWSDIYNSPAYMVYGVSANSAGLHEQTLAAVGAQGNRRDFKFRRIGSNFWRVEIVGGPEGYRYYSRGGLFQNASLMQVGGEFITHINYPAYANTFGFTGLRYESYWSGVWKDMDPVNGSGPGCLTQYTGQRTGDWCLIHPHFNGVPYSNSRWDWNKPL